MEGPSFFCSYLGYTAISKPPTSMAVLQTPVREMYYKYRKSPSTGRQSNLRLTQRGVLVLLYGDGNAKASNVVASEMFFDFSAVVFVETAEFSPIRTSSERKPKAVFLPIEQHDAIREGVAGVVGRHKGKSKEDGKGGVVPEKHAFLVDKSVHFLVTTAHPPLVVCVVRRPQGVKALDCHVFALDTVENALHVSALIASTQVPTGVPGKTPASGVGGINRLGGAGFEKGRGGSDVIRTEYGEYSVYRGPQSPGYEGPGGDGMSHFGQQRSGIGAGIGALDPNIVRQPGGRNDNLIGGHPGGILLTQDIILADSAPQNPHHHQQYQYQERGQFVADVIPPGTYLGGDGVHGSNQRNSLPPDVIMQTSRPISGGNLYGADDGLVQTHIHDRSFGSVVTGGGGSSNHSSGGVRMRHEDGGFDISAGSRHSGGNGSHFTDNGRAISPRGSNEFHVGTGAGARSSGYIPPGAKPMFPGGAPMLPPPSQLRVLETSHALPSYVQDPPPPTSPKSNRTGGFVVDRNSGGPEMSSASNRESRTLEEQTDPECGPLMGGKPVAKVPPHFKAAGVKVLPSDFRAVKLKHNTNGGEDRQSSDISDDKVGYDNNKDIMNKYRDMQEKERDVHKVSGGVNLGYPDVTRLNTNHQEASSAFIHRQVNDDDNFGRSSPGQPYHRGTVDSNAVREEHARDFRSRWEDPADNIRVGGGVFYDHQKPSFIREDGRPDINENRGNNRFSNHGDQNYHQNIQRHHFQGANVLTDTHTTMHESSSDDPRFKDLELANMFSHVRLQNNSSGGNSRGGDTGNSSLAINNGNNNYYNNRSDRFESSSAQDFENGLGYLP